MHSSSVIIGEAGKGGLREELGLGAGWTIDRRFMNNKTSLGGNRESEATRTLPLNL